MGIPLYGLSGDAMHEMRYDDSIYLQLLNAKKYGTYHHL
jgi:hypothetical protein